MVADGFGTQHMSIFAVGDSIDGYSGEHPLTPQTIRAILELIAEARAGDVVAGWLLPALSRRLQRELDRAEADLADAGRNAEVLDDHDGDRLAMELDHLEARCVALRTLLSWVAESYRVSPKKPVGV